MSIPNQYGNRLTQFVPGVIAHAIMSSIVIIAGCLPSPSFGADTHGEVDRPASDEWDPNLPGQFPPPVDGRKVDWIDTTIDPSSVQVTINAPGFGGSFAQYLGWNEEGSLLKDGKGQIVVWNLRANSLTVRYNSMKDIPTSVIVALRNSVSKDQYLADRGIVTHAPKPAPLPPAEAPKNDGGILTDAVKKAQAQGSLAPNAAPSAPVLSGNATGKDAVINGGVLTFTDSATSSKVSFRVERPPVPPNVQPDKSVVNSASSGTWLAFNVGGDPNNNKVIQVGTDNSVKLTDMDPKLKANFELLKKVFGTPR